MIKGRLGWLAVGIGLSAAPLAAQLGEPSADEAKLGRPSPFEEKLSATPPNADPRDFSGAWRPLVHFGPGGPPLGPPPGPVRPSSRYCIPPQMTLASVEGGTVILQRPEEIRIVTEEMHSNRRIYIDQPHTSPAVRSVNGDSVAHWDGNTLVVETTDLIGYGISPTLVRTERWSKNADGSVITDEVTAVDRATGKASEPTTVQLSWAPGTQVLEYICEDGASDYMRNDYK